MTEARPMSALPEEAGRQARLVRLIQDAFADCSWNNYERPPWDVCTYLIHRLEERGLLVLPAARQERTP